MFEPQDSVQSRKWMVTINNPIEHGFDHDAIVAIMAGVRGKSLYWCMCDEEGDECETLHTHIFIFRGSPFTARQIGNLFPKCHRDKCYGTSAESRAYVLKEGPKFNKAEDGTYDYVDASGKRHAGRNFSDTFYESGPCPDEHQGRSSAAEIIVSLIRDGFGDEDIIDQVPSAFKDLEKIDRTRSLFRDKKYANEWRNLDITYIFGPTGTGKTRSVMDTYGYANCYRVTDYKHPFDGYEGQSVIVFEEYRSGFRINDMLNYLDGYPVKLPGRYFNRQACYTTVFVITNIPPEAQYPNEDNLSRGAFFRRIHKVVEMTGHGRQEWPGVQAYLDRDKWVQTAMESPEVPF